jgi:hydroxyacylglutathione hydrolase
MNIHPILLGFTHCYIIQDKGTILVDCGWPNRFRSFTKSLRKANIDPGQIDLIINTHGHLDHVGSAKDIQNITRAKIAMHEPDRKWLEESIFPVIPSMNIWGKIILLFSPSRHFPQTSVDIQLSDNDFSLVPFGVAGRVVFTPGHTMGSVSVLLDSGEAFVGDLAMSGIPFRLNPGLPIFAEDITKVRSSIKLLYEKGTKIIYPAHGKPFSIQKII